ncbi:type II toxin-antitoxin system prevent-host-death family antitoxin [Thermithiobacillus plumbiphilus]|uniref:Antitoxin n=1 Tax=Thermithiobacillus plumbiphilus TaxID=1729899 RepID=A0ABU9D800_9PROT
MSEIGAYEAKTHLPQLLERVQKGERFIITKHGHPVAELVPVNQRDLDAVNQVITALRNLRSDFAERGLRLDDLLQEGQNLRELAHEGHRY